MLEGLDPYGYVSSIQETPWLSYLDQSVIAVYPDIVTIDGVPYSDIWLGPNAADSLRLAGLDFISEYNILSNQSEAITYVSGAGYFAGLPIYSVSRPNATLASQNLYYDGPGVYSVGDATLTITPKGTTQVNFDYQSNNSHLYLSSRPMSGYFVINLNTSNNWRLALNAQSGGFAFSGNPDNDYISSPFEFEYTSGNIYLTPEPDDGLLIRVPSSVSDPDSHTVIYDIHDLVNIYPSVSSPQGHTVNIDPELNPDFETDINIGNGIGDLIRTILNILDLLDNFNFEFAPKPDSPDPAPVDPDPAIPDTPVGEQDGTWLDELLRWIKNAIDVISQSVIDAKDSIINEIQDLAQQLSELPQQILEDIETGPSKVFRKAIDVLKSIFLPLLLPIKAMMNLWHYVVEWLSSIASPFLWIFGVMSGTSYYIVLPIYAGLAGAICIAIYKALGR